jgi:hypothetical protein
MIPNVIAVVIGLVLSYEAIFSRTQDGVSNVTLAISGGAVVVLAILARWSRTMVWQSTVNVVLGALLLLYAGARWYFGADTLETFWTALLSGIVISIGALWSVLYRPDAGPAKATF